MKKTQYRQVEVVIECGSTHMVVWIPDCFAFKGNLVIIDNRTWRILQLGFDTVDEPIDVGKLIREHRKNTGDSLPRVAQMVRAPS
jgi:hypothetical protein